MFERGLTHMTIASNAIADFKSRCKFFKTYFPQLDPKVDEDIRSSYRGGFTYLNDKYIQKEVGNGVSIDVNSLYPSVMKFEPAPIGSGVFFEGQYEEDELYPLYVQTITCRFRLKPNKIPCGGLSLISISNLIPNSFIVALPSAVIELNCAHL